MIKNFRGILGTWVFSSETKPALPLGKIIDIIVDPRNAACAALWVQTFDGLRLIDFRDIQNWDKDIYISSQQDVLKPKDFPKISTIIDKEVPIISAKVFVREANIPRKIGVVQNFSFQQKFPVILSLEVNTGWWIFGKKIKIPRNRILEINEKGIFITNNLIKVDEEAKSSALPSLD